jgi:hypothetical protein
MNSMLITVNFGFYESERDTLIITHNAGFFSCCSVLLHMLIEYHNKYRKIPTILDTSNTFSWYKTSSNDIYNVYFSVYDRDHFNLITKNIDYHQYYQFNDFSRLKYDLLKPFIKHYFSPSPTIQTHIHTIEAEYNLLEYDNISTLFYRGNDKITETILSSYNEYITYAKQILDINPKMKFLIQSDETQFIETMQQNIPNTIVLDKYIRHIPKSNTTVDIVFRSENHLYSQYYLAITIIMSKTKYIVCQSGNCSIWIMFYRGNCNNVIQFKEGNWIDHRQ